MAIQQSEGYGSFARAGFVPSRGPIYVIHPVANGFHLCTVAPSALPGDNSCNFVFTTWEDLLKFLAERPLAIQPAGDATAEDRS